MATLELVKALSYQYDHELGTKAETLRSQYRKLHGKKITELRNQKPLSYGGDLYLNLNADEKDLEKVLQREHYQKHQWTDYEYDKYIVFYKKSVDEDNPFTLVMAWSIIIQIELDPEFCKTEYEYRNTDEKMSLEEILTKYPEAIEILAGLYSYEEIIEKLTENN